LKKVVDVLASKNIILKSLEEIKLSSLGSRKKIQLFSGVKSDGYYLAVFSVNQKSRFLIKNANELIELEKRLELLKEHAYRYKYLLIASALCSKAKLFLKENGWKILEEKS